MFPWLGRAQKTTRLVRQHAVCLLDFIRIELFLFAELAISCFCSYFLFIAYCED